MAREEGTVLPAADSSTERPTRSDRLMESICDPANLATAMAKVIANGGTPGVDGMRVNQLEKYFERHRDRIVGELLDGTYQPQPVQRVEIPKPDGGVRKLGIPTAVDRVIPTGDSPGAVTAIGWDVFGQQLRLSAGTVGPRRRSPSPGIPGGRLHMGGRHGSGKVLRPRQS